MNESSPEWAFLIGLISAASLPIGAITARLWVPSDRQIAFLMAFGGGALLAALSVDLVASALSRGQLVPMSAGWVIGGLLFIVLNQIVNNFGGFMRKASTTIYHLRRQQNLQIKRVLTGLMRSMEVLQDMPEMEVRALAASVRQLDFKAGARLYEVDDPGEALYIVADGVIELLDPRDNLRLVQRFERNMSFGHMAFFTGTSHATIARAATDASVWLIQKNAIERLLPNSSILIQAVHRWIRTAPVAEYLVHQHGMSPQDASDWCDRGVKSLLARGLIPAALETQRQNERFCQRAAGFRRLPLFRGLPPGELERIAASLLHKHVARGHAFFHQGETAERLYIIDHGEVSLIDPTDPTRTPTTLGGDDIFGAMALLTGARHSVTAIAAQDAQIWELRRHNFEDLLHQAPGFAQRVREIVRGGEIGAYLERKQHFDPDKAERWIREALKSMGSGTPLPTARGMSFELSEHKGAPLAIWLGILLDGIPEGLVIGSTMLGQHVSLSLLAGLFISNYPEALSSSVGMKQQGFSFGRILLMWSSIALATGLLAAAGNILFVGTAPAALAFVQGIAAGAMLTMIAQTMLPEAYFKGGTIIGLATMLGFLAAILSKTLE
jgi:CRP-like cAMP-binding protein